MFALPELPAAPLQLLHLPWLDRAGVQVAVLRLDLIDPLISGNKWFKLKHHLLAAQAQGLHGLVSLGGAHSNHLHALAAAGKRLGVQTVGLLRGHPQATPTVADLQAFGMHLHWLGYGGYRQRHSPGFWDSWQQLYPGFLPIPEGGAGPEGVRGCAGIVKQMRQQLSSIGWAGYDAWWLAAGTGTTAAGLALAEAGAHLVYAALAVPEGHGVAEQLQALGAPEVRQVAASRGGFAKVDATLLAFMAETEAACGLPLEPLYTAKALLALCEAVQGGQVERGQRLIFVHTGGLQGRRGFA
jgi:1-aminocyclopropane-1-carboxylate deaminase